MTDHSFVTRAIVQAFNDRYELCGPFDDDWQELCLAAAFRALAEHGEAPGCFDFDEAVRCRDMEVIAANLEGGTSTSSTH